MSSKPALTLFVTDVAGKGASYPVVDIFWSNLREREGNRTLHRRKRSRNLGIERFASHLFPEILDLIEAGTETAA